MWRHVGADRWQPWRPRPRPQWARRARGHSAPSAATWPGRPFADSHRRTARAGARARRAGGRLYAPIGRPRPARLAGGSNLSAAAPSAARPESGSRGRSSGAKRPAGPCRRAPGPCRRRWHRPRSRTARERRPPRRFRRIAAPHRTSSGRAPRALSRARHSPRRSPLSGPQGRDPPAAARPIPSRRGGSHRRPGIRCADDRQDRRQSWRAPA